MKKLAVVLATLLMAVSVAAKAVKAPLPDALINAKTIYIDNESGHAEMLDRAYDELKKWGRYTVVQDSSQADVVLVLRVVDTGRAIQSAGGNGYSWTDSQGHTYSYADAWGTSREVFASRVDLISRKDNVTLWLDSRAVGWHSATREMIKDWRKRTEQQIKR
jgi:hypothetical protein